MKQSKGESRTEQISTIWPFGKYGDVVEQRKKSLGGDGKMKGLTNCFKCKRKFGYGDDVNVAFLKAHKNVFLCNDCADKMAKEGEEA